MVDRYECPKCQSQLVFWEEYVFQKERSINKKTGLLNKKVKNGLASPLGTTGLTCSDVKCGFIYYENNSGNEVNYDHLNKLFQMQ